jgi:hypothetical protein
MTMRRFGALIAIVVLACASPAQAVLIPAASSVGSPPAAAGDGLNGFYWNFSADNQAQADAVIAANPPTATFSSTLVDYPNGPTNVTGDGTLVNAYLGVDGPVDPAAAGTNNLVDSVFRFTGFIKIIEAFDVVGSNATIDVNFAVGSDDGMLLKIGGVNVAQFNGLRSFGFTTGQANFEAAGLYPVDLIYYENGGDTGVEFCSSIVGTPVAANCGQTGQPNIVPTSVLYKTAPGVTPVPEPATLLLFGAGLVGLVGFRRR